MSALPSPIYFQETYYLSVNGSTAVPIEPKTSKIVSFYVMEDKNKVSRLKKEYKKIKSDFDLVNLIKSIENRG